MVTAALNTANIVGVAGAPPTGLITYLTAGAYMDSEGAPRDGRRAVVVEPFTSATIVDSLKGLFVPQEAIGEQYRKGLMGRDSAGVNWKLDQNVVSQTFGSNTGTPSVTINSTDAGILTSGWASQSTVTLSNGAAGGNTMVLNVGDVITFAGVYGANPQNRQSYGRLRNFVVKSAVAVTSAATQTVTISPAIISAGQFQNVAISSGAGSTYAVTQFNSTGTTSPQNIMLHRNAFTLAVNSSGYLH